jgi:hypothetical protein
MTTGPASDTAARLPRPLAQLYAAAHEQPTGKPGHASAWYLFEAFVKLSVLPLMARYARGVEIGAARIEELDAAARSLAGEATFADWVAVLRAFARHERQPTAADGASSAPPSQKSADPARPPGRLWGQLNDRRPAASAIASLCRQLEPSTGGGVEPSEREAPDDGSRSILAILDALVPVREVALGREVGPAQSAFDRDVRPLLLPAADELLADGTVDLLGPPGTQLLYVAEVDAADPAAVTAKVLPLHGLAEEATDILLDGDLVAAVAPKAVVLLRPDDPAPLRLDPGVLYDTVRLTPDLLFLDGGRRYQSYVTGRTEVVDVVPAGPLAALVRPATAPLPPPPPPPSRHGSLPSLASLLAGGPVASPSADAALPGTRLGLSDPPAAPARPALSRPPLSGMPLSRPPSRRNPTAPRRAAPALKLRAGEAIHGGRFTVVAFQGGGGMGEVYRARDNTTGEDVALKFLPRERTADPVWLDQLKSEVRSAHRVRSPYVCAVHDIFVPDERHDGSAVPPFISMEFVDGEDLDRQLHRVGGLNVGTVIRIAHELAQGLRAVHKAGLLHRDLKPSNVMLDVNGEVRILDFGIAAPMDVDAGVGGTIAYMAPEVRAGERPATEASDLYAVGLILLELLTGGRPESGSRTDALLRKGTVDETVFGKAREQAPPRLRAAILGCLRPRPDDRFQTVAAFVDALPAESARSVRRAEAIGAIAASDALAPLTPRLLLVAVAAVLVGAIGFVLLQPRHSPTVRTKVTADVTDLRARAAAVADQLAKPWGAARVPDADQEWGFGPNRDLLAAPNGGSQELPAACFWYRSSPRPLEPFNSVTGVTDVDPPTGPAAAVVRFDPAGDLMSASRRPADREAGQAALAAPVPPDPAALAALFAAAGGRAAAGEVPVVRPSSAWRAVWPDGGPVPVWTVTYANRPYVVATVGGAVAYLKRDDPAPPPVIEDTAGLRETLLSVNFWWTGVATVVGLLLARRNVRLGRCDVRTATRLALLVFAAGLVGWVLVTHPQVSGRGALARWTAGAGVALFSAGQAWVFCAAVDPYARLTWKRCLIGYARLTTDWPASLRDPLVGRSLLVGLGFGLGMTVMLRAADLLNDSPAAPYTALLREQLYMRAWGSSVRSAGLLFGAVAVALRYTLQQLVIIVLMYWLTRVRALALVLFCVANTGLMIVMRADYATSAAAAMAVFSVLTATLIVREGILASAVGMFVLVALLQAPLTLDPAAWNFGFSLGVLALLAGVAGVGLAAALPADLDLRRLSALFRDPIEPGADTRPDELRT